jgi:hypothetical protein
MKQAPRPTLGLFYERPLELDASAKLRGATRIGLCTRDLTKAGVAEHRTGNGKLRMVGNVVQISLETQPGGFSEVKCEATTKADIPVVIAWTVDVVRSSTRRVAKDEVSGGYECFGIYVNVRWRVERGARDSIPPFAVDAGHAAEGRIVGRHAGSLRGVGSAACSRNGQRRA